MASAALLDRVPIPGHVVHRMLAELPDRATAARDYQLEIARAFGVDEGGQPPSFDLLLLGMGSDGHTASLFPGFEALREGRRWAVSVDAPQRPPAARITLTAPSSTAPGDSACWSPERTRRPRSAPSWKDRTSRKGGPSSSSDRRMAA